MTLVTTLKPRLLSPLYTSFLVLVLLVVVQGCLTSLLIGDLNQRAVELLVERNHQLHQLIQMKTALDILSIVVILTGVGWNVWLLHRRVSVPLRQLTEVGQAWWEGQLEVRLDYSSPDEIGRLAGVLNAMADEIRNRQERSEVRNQQFEELISALSHDLRTPLLATRTTLNSMLKEAFGPVSDTWRDVFEEYRRANEDLIKLVEALLDISRYEAGRGEKLSSEPLNWEKIFVRTTAQISATSQRKCDLTYKISQSLPTIKGDELEIQRVVQNLLDNAVRVSEQNSQIILEVAPLGSTRVQVSVHDNGPGIAPQEKERIFHRFIQGRGQQRGGAGLGLYLCRQIVEAHGGNIGVESTLGKGSTFWFALPVATVGTTKNLYKIGQPFNQPTRRTKTDHPKDGCLILQKKSSNILDAWIESLDSSSKLVAIDK